MHRKLREIELYPPLRLWLKDQGFRVYPESFGYDIVAIRDGLVWIVEMKMSLTQKVILQGMRALADADAVYAATPTSPRKSSIAQCQKLGVGVLRVVGGTIEELSEPRNRAWEPSKTKLLMALDGHPEPEDVRGGMPNIAGCGPAQECERRIDAYRAEHPKATWCEMYKAIPNHYANSRSMQGAMRMLRERRVWVERARKSKEEVEARDEEA